MILYSSTVQSFKHSVDNNQITEKIELAFLNGFGKRASEGERRAWNNSMPYMGNIIRNSKIPDDCGVLIEYNIPTSSKRVDFIVTGRNIEDKENFVLIELKQWNEALATDKEDVVVSFVGRKDREVAHPSYQVWSYEQMITDMNTAVYENGIKSHSCAYLHNYKEKNPEPLKLPQYDNVVNNAPLFFREDNKKLEEFLARHVGKGKGMEILYRIENGRIKPSKKLIEHVSGMFQGNKEFILIDEQKVAFSTIINITSKQHGKNTIIVSGGPGTGKSVISINALGTLLKKELNVKFVAPNAAFRTVIFESLTANKTIGKGRVRNLFSGSAQFYNSKENVFDVLIVDEAHRLKGKGAYQYMGENQIEDIVRASRINIFFVDDMQRIRPEDIGSVSEIVRIANKYNSKIHQIELQAQFRCSGAEGFINWLDTVLQISDTANFNGWDEGTFEFKLFDNPNDVFNEIQTRNSEGYKARMLAGFAWKWTQEKEGNRNGEVEDVEIPKYNFKMPWNSRAISSTWAINESGINQIGCVHTSQGLEFDYVGVIIGDDLKFDPDNHILYASYDDYKDVMGKRGLKDKNDELTKLVSNIYKILMSRGMKGCYVFCRNEELQNHFKERLKMICE